MTIRSILGATLLAALIVFTGCSSLSPLEQEQALKSVKIDEVFFAQHHVQPVTSPYFKLVGNLEALLKVQVTADRKIRSPNVSAVLMFGDREKRVQLRGPRRLPPPYTGEPLLRQHSYDDSFTAMIPKEWIKPGLQVLVEVRRVYGRKRVVGKVITMRHLKDIKVGAPNPVVMQMFDVHYFGQGKGQDYPPGWEDEFRAKFPVSSLEFRRVRGLSFDTLVMPPRGESPAIRCSSEEEYLKRTGMKYDGEQGIALRWIGALRAAAGRGWWRENYYLNISGVHSGGQAGGFRGVGNLARPGVLVHEQGHAFGLPHWGHFKAYPYRGHMLGIKANNENHPHAGPVWAFDLKKREFLSPIVPKGTLRGTPGYWRSDPMQGGGMGDQGKGYHFRHFSDFSVFRMQNRLERSLVRWNEKLGKWTKWNPETNSYSTVIENNGITFPIKRDVPVISLMATISGPTEEANWIYAPIGPYKAGLIRNFDVTDAKDRKDALELKYARDTANTCMRVVQGGKTTTYLLPVAIGPKDDPLSMKSFHVTAINLAADDGEVTKVEVLHTPDVMKKGIDRNAKVLSTWQASPAAKTKP